MKYTSTLAALGTLLALAHSSSAEVLLDYTFGGTDIGSIQQVSNGIGTGYSANTTTGVISTGDGGTNINKSDNATGFNSSSLVDVSSALGFTATFVITSANVNLNASSLDSNGLFFGVVAGTDATLTSGDGLFNNNPDAFGYTPGNGSFTDHAWFEGNGTTDTFGALSTTAPTDDSIESGFTLSITVMNDDTWTMTSIGLSTELNASGTLSTVTYADFNNLGLYTSLQGRRDGSDITMGRMTLETIPEPSSYALLAGLLGMSYVMVRRRS